MIDHGLMAAAQNGILKRSRHWPSVEKAFRKLNPKCAACDSTVIQVHHKWPFHDCILCGRPDLELDPRNLISLDEDGVHNHHLAIGHMGNFESYNDQVDQDCARWANAPWQAIYLDQVWKGRAQARPLSYPMMSSVGQKQFRSNLDSILPVDPAILAKYALTVS